MHRRAEYQRELRSYLAGFGLAVALSALPFACVALHGLARATLLWIIAGAAAAQVVVHLRVFLHVDLSKPKRDNLQLILFSGLLIVLMAGGTLWILGNLRDRMM